MLSESTQLTLLFGGTAILFVLAGAYGLAAIHQWHWFWRAHKEVGKTLLWFPWACYELLKGHMGPDVTNALLAGVIGFACVILAVGIASFANPQVLTTSLLVLGSAYLALGVAVRVLTRPYGILA